MTRLTSKTAIHAKSASKSAVRFADLAAGTSPRDVLEILRTWTYSPVNRRIGVRKPLCGLACGLGGL